MKKESPIGIFDSGIGGLTIWKEIIAILPNESTIYVADSDNAPYGVRSKQEIIDLCVTNTEFLLGKGCKLIVVACNTATTNAISFLRESYGHIKFIGIEPAIKPAALLTKTKVIGVLATKGTLASDLFINTSELYAKNISVVEQIGTGLVELIEAGLLNDAKMKELLLTYLQPMINQNIDYLVLGCTHYPLLRPILEDILPKGVTVIDSGEAVAKRTYNVLKDIDLLRDVSASKSVREFYVNSASRAIEAFLPANSIVNYMK